jgi:hypothetical protein
MEELVKQLTQKFGLDADKAKGIVQTVVAHIQAKLPGPVGDQVAKLLGGAAGAVSPVVKPIPPVGMVSPVAKPEAPLGTSPTSPAGGGKG